MTSPPTTFRFFFFSFKTSRFQVAVGLFCNRPQMKLNYGKNMSDSLGFTLCAIL